MMMAVNLHKFERDIRLGHIVYKSNFKRVTEWKSFEYTYMYIHRVQLIVGSCNGVNVR